MSTEKDLSRGDNFPTEKTLDNSKERQWQQEQINISKSDWNESNKGKMTLRNKEEDNYEDERNIFVHALLLHY